MSLCLTLDHEIGKEISSFSRQIIEKIMHFVRLHFYFKEELEEKVFAENGKIIYGDYLKAIDKSSKNTLTIISPLIEELRISLDESRKLGRGPSDFGLSLLNDFCDNPINYFITLLEKMEYEYEQMKDEDELVYDELYDTLFY